MWSLRIGWVESCPTFSLLESDTRLYLSNRLLGARTFRKLGNGQINTLIVTNEFSSCMQTSTDHFARARLTGFHMLSPSPAQAVPIANLFVTCGRPVERNSFSHAAFHVASWVDQTNILQHYSHITLSYRNHWRLLGSTLSVHVLQHSHFSDNGLVLAQD